MQNLGIVLYTQGNNKRNLKNCLKSLTNFKDNVIVVCDGTLPGIDELEGFETKEYKSTIFASGCYNYGLRHLLNKGVEHFFIVNDNVMILEDRLFDDYINVNSQTKIGFMASSTESDDPYGKGKNNKLTLELKEGYQLLLNKGFNGYLLYLTRETIKKVGFFDERYKGAFEGSDYYKRASDKGVTSYFGWFADVKGSSNNILYQTNRPDSIHPVFNSDTVEDRIIKSMKVFNLKFKTQPQNLFEIYSQKDVVQKLKNLSSR